MPVWEASPDVLRTKKQQAQPFCVPWTFGAERLGGGYFNARTSSAFGLMGYKTMTTPLLKNRRAEAPDILAPDGAEIRILLDRQQGATRLSLAEALVKPGERTACVSHQTIEEFWYILKGAGLFHRFSPDGLEQQTAEVAPGDALLIPTGYRFYVENTGDEDLIFLCADTPPWPGPDEAIVWSTVQ